MSDDLERCSLKDEDELDFSVEIGLLRADEAEDVRRAAEKAIADVERRYWAFTEDAWSSLDPSWRADPLELPTGGINADLIGCLTVALSFLLEYWAWDVRWDLQSSTG